MSKLGEIKNILVKLSGSQLEELDRRPSVKYWMEPEFSSESRKYPQKGKPNSFVKTETSGTMMGLKGGKSTKWVADDIIAYDKKGNIVGVLSVSRTEPVGAFKITVREDAQRQGWGKRLLNEAVKNGIKIGVENNSFSHSGRELMRAWLTEQQK